MTTLVIGGTSGIGREVARALADAGESVILTGRDADRAEKAAKEIGPGARGLAVDLTWPHALPAALSSVEHVDNVVLAAVERDAGTGADYDVDRTIQLATLKLVGYTKAAHAVFPRMSRTGSVVIFGGLTNDRPYPALNGAVAGLVSTLVPELAPIRVNAVHPGVVGDSPHWAGRSLDTVQARTAIGRTVATAEVVDAVLFLLRNPAVNGVNLVVDGGWLAG
ncbi:SDR family oxidoreductase [Streptosporangiaceae bacterium NEAU-GS5]|nr:SDR family oxidoreductase [Streptosporangiaceae bacterium NEAU-GS5]